MESLFMKKTLLFINGQDWQQIKVQYKVHGRGTYCNQEPPSLPRKASLHPLQIHRKFLPWAGKLAICALKHVWKSHQFLFMTTYFNTNFKTESTRKPMISSQYYTILSTYHLGDQISAYASFDPIVNSLKVFPTLFQ